MPLMFPHTRTVLSAMKLVTITFAGYSAADGVEAFGYALVGSSWYRTIGAEYYLSPAVQLAPVRIGAPPASLGREDIRGVVRDLITRGVVPQPKPLNSEDLLYLIYIPPTVMRGPDLQTSSGYHEMIALDDVTRVPIAVALDDGSGLAATTTTAAHQLINAVTNPYEPPKDGYYADPQKSDPWSLVRGEVADLCEGEALFYEGGLVFPRVYSSTAAQASQPPCLPAMPGDTWTDVTANPSQLPIIAPDGQAKFKLTGWSTTEMAAWKLRLRVADSSGLSLEDMRPQFSTDMINNNVTVTLTLHAPFDVSDNTTGGVYILSGPNNHPWAVGFTVRQ